jgi:cobalt/nickel transport system permease protein
MHIPDGYLSPQTYLPLIGIMLTLWAKASRVLRQTLQARYVPLFAMGAAFCFVVMMFNVPIPGGTTGHATGAALIAILLGPWAAVLSVSMALVIQALLFGDGGITAVGANCFNNAVVIPFVAHWTYRIVSTGASITAFRRVAAAGLAGYLGLSFSALVAAVQLGIQPLIARDATGLPLYAPFPLALTLPVMAAGHFLFFGFLEAFVTASVVLYFQKTDLSLLKLAEPVRATSEAAAVDLSLKANES